NVVGLEIAVNQVARVCLIKTNGNLADHPHDTRRGNHLFAIERLTKFFAKEKFHDQRVGTVWELAEVDHLNNMVVGQLLTYLKLSLEALHLDWIASNILMKDFDSHVPAFDHVESFIDATHSAVGD